jgi:S-adenosylmethionine/arginine decarboxylase-like enzyme
MVNKTRKANNHISHHHMLLRMETLLHPSKKDLPKVEELIKTIISELDMKIIDVPHVYYLDQPVNNKGITSATSIETSHISLHIWDTPEPDQLINKKSKSLLQFDIYTCGNLTKKQAKGVIKHLSIYEPTRIDIDVLNRKKKLKIDYSMSWNDTGKSSFDEWLNSKL